MTTVYMPSGTAAAVVKPRSTSYIVLAGSPKLGVETVLPFGSTIYTSIGSVVHGGTVETEKAAPMKVHVSDGSR